MMKKKISVTVLAVLIVVLAIDFIMLNFGAKKAYEIKEKKVGAIFCLTGIVSISCIIYVINLGNALSAVIICPILLISPLILLTKLRDIQDIEEAE